MTSRREFFGFLAAAPIAVPVVVKEIAETSTAGWIKPMRAVTLSNGIGCRIIEGPFLSAKGETITINYSYPAGAHVKRTARQIFQGFGKAVTPNRLYGAQINADGDAV